MKIVNPLSASDPPPAARARHRARVLCAGPLAGALVAAALIAGCSGSSGGGVAQLNTSTTAKSAAKSKQKPSALAWAQCMRSHGMPDFPDPRASGGFSVPSSISSSPAFERGWNDCRSLSPTGQVSASQENAALAFGVKLAQCMQENGVPNYPDPKEGFNGSISVGPSSGTDTNSPAFQRAEKKCGSPLAGPKL